MASVMIKGSEDSAERRDLAKSFRNAFNAFQVSLALLVDPRIGAPYLFYFILQMGLLALYLFVNTGPLASFWAMAVKGVAPEYLGHYPAHLLLLQPILGRIEIFLDVIVKCLFNGATVYLVTRAMKRGRISLPRAFSKAGREYLNLLGVAAVSAVAVYLAVFAGVKISIGMEGLARYGLLGGGIALGLLVQSLFVYCVPFIMIDRLPAHAAIASGVSLSLRTLTKTFLIVALPFLLTVPTILLDMKADMIAIQLSPDFMIHNHIASKVMELVSTYLITASATATFLARKVDRPEGTNIDIRAY
jgi:hypothetical protein